MIAPPGYAHIFARPVRQPSVQRGRLHLKHRWQVCGGLDLSLFVDVQPSECHIDGRRGDAQFPCHKPDHMTGSATAAWFFRHPDLDLRALGLTDNIPAHTLGLIRKLTTSVSPSTKRTLDPI